MVPHFRLVSQTAPGEVTHDRRCIAWRADERCQDTVTGSLDLPLCGAQMSILGRQPRIVRIDFPQTRDIPTCRSDKLQDCRRLKTGRTSVLRAYMGNSGLSRTQMLDPEWISCYY